MEDTPAIIKMKIDKLVQDLLGDKVGTQSVESLLVLLEKAGMAHMARVHCSQIAVHYLNRDGYGVNPQDAAANLSDIAAVSWHDKSFRGVLAEVRPDELDKVHLFNKALVDSSNNTLAPIEKEACKYATLWGSHTNAGHRMVLAGLAHDDERLTVGGKLSLAKVKEVSPSLGETIQRGCEWLIISGDFLAKNPGLAQIIQSAGNTGTNISKAEHDLQMVRKIATGIEQGMQAKDILKAIARSRPKNAEAAMAVFNFVRKHAGPNQCMLKFSEAFIRANSSSERRVSSEAWDQLQSDWKGAYQAPWVRHGMLCLLYTHRNHKFLTTGDMKKASGKDLLQSLAAEKEICNMMDHLHNSSVKDSGDAKQAIGHFMMNIVALLLGKETDAMKALGDQISMGALAFVCVSAIQARTGVKITCAYDAHALQDASGEGSAASDSKPAARSATGDLTAVLMAELGFKIGDMAKGSDKAGKILQFDNGIIQLCNIDDETSIFEVKLEAFQKKEWKIRPTATVEWIDTWQLHAPELNTMFTTNFVKSCAQVECYQAVGKQMGLDGIRVASKPRMVVATRSFAKGELVVAPLTSNFIVKELAKNTVLYNKTMLYLGKFSVDSKSFQLFASASFQPATDKKQGFVCPFWHIDTTSKKADANMQLSMHLQSAKIDVENCIVKVPLAQSSKNIKEGDQLIMYIPEPEKDDKATGAPPAKKCKKA